ncbi:MAG: hypothetical protein ACRDQ7_08650 [Haloechinothrix sp.]
MLQGLTLPDSWRTLLETFRPVFRRSSTVVSFSVLATGLVARTARRTVVGMLAGAGTAAVVSLHPVCRLFSHHARAADRFGPLPARLIVTRLIGADAPVPAAVDGTLLRRWGRKVHRASWTQDGAAQGPAKLGRGNRWVIAGIVVDLPLCTHPVCLPVLFRLWGGKGSASPVALAAESLKLLAGECSDRVIQGVGDAAYHGRALLVAGPTWTTRPPSIAAGKQLLGIGQARNRLPRAVERTVPFGFAVYSLIIVWYASNGYHPDDITSRLAAQPCYDHKTSARVRRHAHQAPPHPRRRPSNRRWRSSTRPRRIPRLRPGLRRHRRITAKLKRVVTRDY